MTRYFPSAPRLTCGFGGLVLTATLAIVAGCSRATDSGGGAGVVVASGIRIDGSSTVFLISEAVAEDFRDKRPDVKVSVSESGTGGGMKKFSAGEIDICDASRPIKPSEIELCKQKGVEYIQLSVAFDGMAVVVNKDNSWVTSMTVDQLKRLWQPGSTITQWSDLDPQWPAEKIILYGPGNDSGTFDYFTEVICGEAKASRPDYTASENDDVLVTGVENSKNALGYFGYAYYEANKDGLKLVAIDSGKGPIAPSPVTVRDKTYEPLSRPLFIYVRTSSLQRPEVAEFLQFYLDNCSALAAEVGYVAADDEAMQANRSTFKEALAALPKD